jgi:hypothetical protein
MLAKDKRYELSRDVGCYPVTRTGSYERNLAVESRTSSQTRSTKLGSNWSIHRQNHTKRGDNTQNKPKRNN